MHFTSLPSWFLSQLANRSESFYPGLLFCITNNVKKKSGIEYKEIIVKLLMLDLLMFLRLHELLFEPSK